MLQIPWLKFIVVLLCYFATILGSPLWWVSLSEGCIYPLLHISRFSALSSIHPSRSFTRSLPCTLANPLRCASPKVKPPHLLLFFSPLSTFDTLKQLLQPSSQKTSSLRKGILQLVHHTPRVCCINIDFVLPFLILTTAESPVFLTDSLVCSIWTSVTPLTCH